MTIDIRHILVPIDFSEHAEYVIEWASHLAAEHASQLVLLHGTSATVKKMYRERDGRIRLQPANETLQPTYVHENDITIQGVVVGVLRRY